jgi:hypothetical protein
MLAEERRKRGWSLRRAGWALGCSYETVRLLELRRRVPSTALALTIARVYHLPGPAITQLMAQAVDDAGMSRP